MAPHNPTVRVGDSTGVLAMRKKLEKPEMGAVVVAVKTVPRGFGYCDVTHKGVRCGTPAGVSVSAFVLLPNPQSPRHPIKVKYQMSSCLRDINVARLIVEGRAGKRREQEGLQN